MIDTMNTIDNNTENSSSVNLVSINSSPLALVATSNSSMKIAQNPTQNRNARNGIELEVVKLCNTSSNTNVDLLVAMTTRGCPPNRGVSTLPTQDANKLSGTP